MVPGGLGPVLGRQIRGLPRLPAARRGTDGRSLMATPSAGPVGSLDELKRVEDTETEWTERLRAARENADATLKRLREEAEGRIGLARTAAQQAREERMRAAQQEAEREAAKVLADGDQQVEAIVSGAGQRPDDQRDAILSAVLGEFRPD